MYVCANTHARAYIYMEICCMAVYKHAPHTKTRTDTSSAARGCDCAHTDARAYRYMEICCMAIYKHYKTGSHSKNAPIQALLHEVVIVRTHMHVHIDTWKSAVCLYTNTIKTRSHNKNAPIQALLRQVVIANGGFCRTGRRICCLTIADHLCCMYVCIYVCMCMEGWMYCLTIADHLCCMYVCIYVCMCVCVMCVCAWKDGYAAGRLSITFAVCRYVYMHVCV
jgi:hypothetical protein